MPLQPDEVYLQVPFPFVPHWPGGYVQQRLSAPPRHKSSETEPPSVFVQYDGTSHQPALPQGSPCARVVAAKTRAVRKCCMCIVVYIKISQTICTIWMREAESWFCGLCEKARRSSHTTPIYIYCSLVLSEMPLFAFNASL